ncbi:F-box/FBD/LRR-repeat protein At1g13570-like [Bidens hawaiensis]|uniref:F-box/FBD/LRR-repeat protein At1g13570-like n=1 Tax=Bidens hawaiensis TaxID=980011 RepID=UPI004049D105
MEAKRLHMDMISNLPSPIIETILSLVSFKEAARTSVLSREWKYHWTKYPKLEFVEGVGKSDKLEERLSITSQAKRKLLYAIKQVLSVHQGPIHEFSLSAYADGPYAQVHRIIDNLSRNNNATLKKLTLDMFGYWLPESLFSLHKLTGMYLHRCRLDVPPTFSGFGSLTNLYMEKVIITNKMLLLFLSGCPSLKTFVLNPEAGSLPAIDDTTTVVELFEYLPVIENLFIRLPLLKSFAQGRVPNKLPVALVHLKYLCIRDTLPYYERKVPCYAFLIRSSPNLEKLKLKLSCSLFFGISDKLDDYSDIWLEHLNALEIELWTPRNYGLCFVRLILAKSPALKKVKILFCRWMKKDERLKISRYLLQSPRVSPHVEFLVETGGEFDRSYFKRTIYW